jgi:hypothetical protein
MAYKKNLKKTLNAYGILASTIEISAQNIDFNSK